MSMDFTPTKEFAVCPYCNKEQTVFPSLHGKYPVCGNCKKQFTLCVEFVYKTKKYPGEE